jgi:hypothetical protein
MMPNALMNYDRVREKYVYIRGFPVGHPNDYEPLIWLTFIKYYLLGGNRRKKCIYISK